MLIAKPPKEYTHPIGTSLNGSDGQPSYPHRFSKFFDFALEATWRQSGELAVKSQPTLSNANEHQWRSRFVPVAYQWALLCCPFPAGRFDLLQSDFAKRGQ